MEGVQFDEPQAYKTHYPQAVRGGKGISGFLIGKGIAKTESQANAILITILILAVIIAIALPNLFGSGVKEKTINPADDKTLEI